MGRRLATLAPALLVLLLACGGPEAGPTPEEADRRARFEAVLRHLRREMPRAEIVLRGERDAVWEASLEDRGLLGKGPAGEATGWRLEIGILDVGRTTGGDAVLRAVENLRHPGGRSEHRITYLLERDPATGWRVTDSRVEYVADYLDTDG